MSTLSVPLGSDQQKFIESYVKSGQAENKAQVVRRALKLLAEEEAVQAVLKAQREPTIRGDLQALMKKIK